MRIGIPAARCCRATVRLLLCSTTPAARPHEPRAGAAARRPRHLIMLMPHSGVRTSQPDVSDLAALVIPVHDLTAPPRNVVAALPPDLATRQPSLGFGAWRVGSGRRPWREGVRKPRGEGRAPGDGT